MHSCPDCGQACVCGGDLDDLLWGDDSEEALACEHVCGPEADDLEDLGMPGYEEDGQSHCRVCGCSEFNACPGGCIWATPDLCSRCVSNEVTR